MLIHQIFEKKFRPLQILHLLGIFLSYLMAAAIYASFANREFTWLAWGITAWAGLAATFLVGMIWFMKDWGNLFLTFLYLLLPIFFCQASLMIEGLEMPTAAYWIYTTRYSVLLVPIAGICALAYLNPTRFNIGDAITEEDYDDLS